MVTVTPETVLDGSVARDGGKALFWRGLSGDGVWALTSCGPNARARTHTTQVRPHRPRKLSNTFKSHSKAKLHYSIIGSRLNSDESCGAQPKLGHDEWNLQGWFRFSGLTHGLSIVVNSQGKLTWRP
jgi:hypothetical protein